MIIPRFSNALNRKNVSGCIFILLNGSEKPYNTALRMEINKFLCKCETMHNSLLKELFNPNTKKEQLFSINIGYSKCLNTRKKRNLYILFAISFITSIFPKFGKRLYYISITKFTKLVQITSC